MSDLVQRPITEDDCLAWAGLLAAAEPVDDTGENYDADDLVEELADESIDPARDTKGLWLGDKMLGYALVRGATGVVDGVYRVHVEGTVAPADRRRGHGQRLLDWSLARAREVHAERHPDVPGTFAVRVGEAVTGAHAMLERAGFVRARWFFQLTRSLDQAPPAVRVPDGLRLVPYDGGYDEQTRLAHNEAFGDHWGSSPSTPQSWAHWSVGQRAFRPALSYLMLDDLAGANPVVGYLLSYEYDADTAATGIREAYVGILGTRREWRGRGVARALLGTAVGAYGDAGFARTSLDVDADNATGALGLYTSLGYAKDRTSISFSRPID
jgi:mycothiol synthase